MKYDKCIDYRASWCPVHLECCDELPLGAKSIMCKWIGVDTRRRRRSTELIDTAIYHGIHGGESGSVLEICRWWTASNLKYEARWPLPIQTARHNLVSREIKGWFNNSVGRGHSWSSQTSF